MINPFAAADHYIIECDQDIQPSHPKHHHQRYIRSIWIDESEVASHYYEVYPPYVVEVFSRIPPDDSEQENYIQHCVDFHDPRMEWDIASQNGNHCVNQNHAGQVAQVIKKHTSPQEIVCSTESFPRFDYIMTFFVPKKPSFLTPKCRQKNIMVNIQSDLASSSCHHWS